MATLFLILIAALFVGTIVLYAANIHWWRVSLIAGIVFGAVGLLWVPGDGDPETEGFDGYTPADRLKPGIDLAGGTRLVYDVVVPDGKPKGQVIEETIEILADRVDPTGTRGLVWREVAGQRIEVSMASAPAKVRESRDAYNDAVKALGQNNLTPADLDRALQADSTKALDDLAKSNTELRAELTALKDLYDQREAKKALYYEADAAWNKIPADQREANNDLYERLVLAEDFYFDVLDKFKAKQTEILEANSFNPAAFDFLRAIPPKKLSKEEIEAGETTPREDRLAKLKEDFPNRAEALQTAYDALVAYEAVKGPLDGPEDLIALLQGSGVMEFRIAADPNLAGMDEYRLQLDEQGPRARPEAPFRWFEVDNIKNYAPGQGADQAKALAQIEGWLVQSLSLDPQEQIQAAFETQTFFQNRLGVVAHPYAGRLYVLLHNDEGMAMTRDQTWAVSGVNRGMDQMSGRPTVNYSLDGKGAALMGILTRPNVGRPMAVLIDDKVLTTPSINSPLRDRVQISGEFSEAEIKYLRDTMRAGALEGQLSEFPVSQLTIGATLGQDNVRAGLRAAVTAIILVAIFMAIYYFFRGHGRELRAGSEHGADPGHPRDDAGDLYPPGYRGPGVDDRYGGRRERADLRAYP